MNYRKSFNLVLPLIALFVTPCLSCAILGIFPALADKCVLSRTSIIYYPPPNYQPVPYGLNEINKIVNSNTFNPALKTTVYLHGYVETPSVQTVQSIVAAYKESGSTNLLVLDWSDLVKPLYTTSVLHIIPMARVLAKYLNENLDRNSIHLVGHSLGGQLAGAVGREIQRLTSTNGIYRATALDPALPEFAPIALVPAISGNDAQFVDVIHTDGGFYGMLSPCGQVDFYPNLGISTQPGCPPRTFIPLDPVDLCSHQRSVYLWADSLIEPSNLQFVATKTPSSVETPVTALMGINADLNGRPENGIYYLETHGSAPFAKG